MKGYNRKIQYRISTKSSGRSRWDQSDIVSETAPPACNHLFSVKTLRQRNRLTSTSTFLLSVSFKSRVERDDVDHVKRESMIQADSGTPAGRGMVSCVTHTL